jgi:hypothetical protein
VEGDLKPEGLLRMSWPSWRPPPGDGVVAVLSGPDVRCGWADALLARVGQRLVVWTGAGSEPVVRGLEVVDQPAVVAAAVSPAGADARYVIWRWSSVAGSRCGAAREEVIRVRA